VLDADVLDEQGDGSDSMQCHGHADLTYARRK
jgi:hypothetical protein